MLVHTILNQFLFDEISRRHSDQQNITSKEGSAAMMAIMRSAGVAPEVNLRKPLNTSDEVLRKGSILALKHRPDRTRSSKRVVPLKGPMSSKN